MQLDFFSDWLELAGSRLKKAGYELPSRVSGDELAIAYLNVLRRYIAIQPREVHLSSEFTCPPKFEEAIGILERKARQGKDLNPHLSRQLLRLDFHDRLLNHWGLHHFHFGKESQEEYFVGRSGQLLFAHISSSAAFFVQVGEHGDWADETLLEIIHANWPELLEPYELKGLLPPAPGNRWSPQETMQLRNAGIVPPIVLSNGRVYAPLGGGYATSGVSTVVMTTLMNIRSVVRQMEDAARALVGGDEGPWTLVIQDGTSYVENHDGERLVLGQTSL